MPFITAMHFVCLNCRNTSFDSLEFWYDTVEKEIGSEPIKGLAAKPIHPKMKSILLKLGFIINTDNKDILLYKL